MRVLLILIVVLGGLFVAADRITVSYADSKAADRIQSACGLASKPDVSIKGFPFLTQALARDLDHVTITINDLPTSSACLAANGTPPLHVTRFHADLRNIRPEGGFSNFSGATADAVTGTALISYADLSKVASGQLSAVASDVTVAYGGTGRVRISGTVHVPLLGTEQVSGVSSVTVRNGDKVGISLPNGLSHVLGFAGLSWPVTGLPTGIRLSSVQATPGGLQVSITGTSVQLTQ
jgi:hypothetical protein